MTRFALITLCCLLPTLRAASLQDPTFTTALYTTYYAGGLNMGLNELNGINNNGVAVGEYANYSSKINPPHVDVYANGQIQDLYSIPGGSKLTGINDNNTFVGYGPILGNSGISGFIGVYDPGNLSSAVTAFNFPGATATYPYAINDQGTIVGVYVSNGVQHGFIYQKVERSRPWTTQKLQGPPSWASITWARLSVMERTA